MAHGKKPKSSHTLTLHFDSKVGIDNFVAWYLDGGGEQNSKYYSIAWGKDWIHVKPSDEACPKCEHEDEDHPPVEGEPFECTNCGHKEE